MQFWQVFRIGFGRAGKQGRRRKLCRSLEHWRHQVRTKASRHHVRALASDRANKSLSTGVIGFWSLHTRCKLRMQRKLARLAQDFRRGLLQRCLRCLRNHVWSLRAELRVRRACAAKRRWQLRESVWRWSHLVDFLKHRFVAVGRLISRSSFRLVQCYWRAWAQYAAHVWSVLIKSSHRWRYGALHSSLNCWSIHASTSGLTRQV